MVILAAVWFGKVLRDHSELAPHLAWLLVVISSEQEPARLGTAYPNRKDPPLWNE